MTKDIKTEVDQAKLECKLAELQLATSEAIKKKKDLDAHWSLIPVQLCFWIFCVAVASLSFFKSAKFIINL